ncbi:MAG: hypothetical protein ABI972_32005 [Acidobacteriota bacterium]
MQRLVLLTLAASTCFAQFSEFAVTDDGRLFFSSPLSMGAEDSRSKIYRVTSDGVALFASGGGLEDPLGPAAYGPFASGDGSITGYALNFPCRTGSCGFFAAPRTFYQLQGVDLNDVPYNELRISRNGRYFAGTTFDVRVRLIDIPSMQSREMPQFFRTAGTQPVANTGAMLLLDGRQTGEAPLVHVPLGEDPRVVPGTDRAVSGILSPGGDFIAYQRIAANGSELLLTDPQGSMHRLLVSTPARFSFQPSFANDGTLLYLQPDVEGNAVPMLLPPAGQPRMLIALPRGVTQAILSGNGQLAWLSTANGQLLRVRTLDSVADEFIGETPGLSPNSYAAYPGSVVRMSGTGLSAGTQYFLDDIALGVSEMRGQEVALQIPWEFPRNDARHFIYVRGAQSPFRQRFAFSTYTEPTVTFEVGGSDRVLQAAHEDFRGVVSAADPARPGETVHVFAANMGPVDHPVATGERSPTSPLARVITPMACYLLALNTKGEPLRSEGLAVPFAGLAGGLIGIYQIDVTIPPNWAADQSLLQCRMQVMEGLYRGSAAPIPIAAIP